jgi:hypothetical protein
MTWMYNTLPGAARAPLQTITLPVINGKKLLEIANLEVDCRIGKSRHLSAADRKDRWRICLGLFAVIGSAVISSGIGQGALVLGEIYVGKGQVYEAWAGTLRHILPLLVGISTAVIGFLGLEKQTTQHRAIGNAYIEIARKARSILNTVDATNYSAKLVEYDRLLARYLEVNKEGESCPTNDNDSQRALGMNAARRSAIKQKISENETAHLGISEKRPISPASLKQLVARAVWTRAAAVLALVGLMSKSDYRKYLKEARWPRSRPGST